MGKRSRKRASPDAPRPPAPAVSAGTSHAPARGRPVSRKARREEAPQALWHPVPLTELLIFAGLILVLIGFFGGTPVALVVGIVLVSVAALELSIREHLAGYKSHSALLAGVAVVVLVIPLYFTSLPQGAILVIGAVVFAGVFQLLRSVFAKQAGGLKFRA